MDFSFKINTKIIVESADPDTVRMGKPNAFLNVT